MALRTGVVRIPVASWSSSEGARALETWVAEMLSVNPYAANLQIIYEGRREATPAPPDPPLGWTVQ